MYNPSKSTDSISINSSTPLFPGQKSQTLSSRIMKLFRLSSAPKLDIEKSTRFEEECVDEYTTKVENSNYAAEATAAQSSAKVEHWIRMKVKDYNAECLTNPKTPSDLLLNELNRIQILLPFIEACAAFLSTHSEHFGTLFNPTYNNPFRLFLTHMAKVRFSSYKPILEDIQTEKDLKKKWTQDIVDKVMNSIRCEFCKEEEGLVSVTKEGDFFYLGTKIDKYHVDRKTLERFIKNSISYDSFEEIQLEEGKNGFKIKIHYLTMDFRKPSCNCKYTDMMLEDSYIKFSKCKYHLVRIGFYPEHMTVKSINIEENGLEVAGLNLLVEYSKMKKHFANSLIAPGINLDLASEYLKVYETDASGSTVYYDTGDISV